MSRRRVYSEATLGIMRRFFEAFEFLRAARAFRSVRVFCTECGIEYRHFYMQKADLWRGYFEVSWMLPLMSHYGVSPKWLLFGEGTMLRARRSTTSTTDSEDAENA